MFSRGLLPLYISYYRYLPLLAGRYLPLTLLYHYRERGANSNAKGSATSTSAILGGSEDDDDGWDLDFLCFKRKHCPSSSPSTPTDGSADNNVHCNCRRHAQHQLQRECEDVDSQNVLEIVHPLLYSYFLIFLLFQLDGDERPCINGNECETFHCRSWKCALEDNV